MDYINPEEPQWPVTQGFGASPGGYNPVGGHTGRDKGTPVGRPLRAPADGVITLAGNAGPWSTNPYWLEGSFAGLSVVLDTGPYAFTLNHLSAVLVKKGQRVRKGDIIANSGNTGAATSGPHHHFEVMPDGWNFQNGTYGRINPDTVVKGYFNGAVSVAFAPNQRVNGPQVTYQRREAKVDGLAPGAAGSNIVRTIPAGQLEVWEGFVHGQSITVGGLTSDIWYQDKVGYAWAGAFVSQSTTGLPDLTPRKTLAANQRRVGPAGAKQRSKPLVTATVIREIPGGQVEVFTGYVRGQEVTVNGFTSDIWYVDAKGYVWSGAFEAQGVVGLPDLTVPAPPIGRPIVVAPAPAPVPAPAEQFAHLNGIDVAKYQEAASLNTLGADFIIIKASEGGANWADSALASNVAEARLTGKPVGFYHYARPYLTPENTAAEEARSFLKVIEPHLRPGDLLALDWEAENQHRTDWAEEWLGIVKAATGALPLLYASEDAVKTLDWASVQQQYPLWLASYGQNPALTGFAPPQGVTVPWQAGVRIWQYGSKGRLPGYNGDLDFNVFYGTGPDWQSLGAEHVLTDPPANPPVTEPAPPITDNKDDSLTEFSEWLIREFRNREKK
jgi:GH25 family lysozyme M1 (1,4-beta-N-acetylmuramidase)